jgi:membrane protein DedA with SNARE-associated domain
MNPLGERHPRHRFLILNVIGALFRDVVVAVLGHAPGHALKLLLGDARKYKLRIFDSLYAAGRRARWWAADRGKKRAEKY